VKTRPPMMPLILRFTIRTACARFCVPAFLLPRRAPGYVLFGTQASFVKQTFDPQEANLRRGFIPADTAWGAEPEENWAYLPFPQEIRSNGGAFPRSSATTGIIIRMYAM